MTARPAHAAALLLVACGWLPPGAAQAQGAAEVARVGVVVRDAAASAAAYAALSGIAAPAVEAARGDEPARVARLQQHGGELAADGGSHAYFDLRPRLGLLVEALAPAASDAIYPHPHDGP